MKSKKQTHLLMGLLVIIWSFDAITISTAVASMNQVFLLCMKYLCALPVILLFVRFRGKLRLPGRKDIKWLVLSSLLGDILYFGFEYTAYKYLPASIVTLLLGFLPAVSYLVDCAVYHKRLKIRVVITILISLCGLALVVWDLTSADKSNWIGFACCLVCVLVWVLYGFVTRYLDAEYSSEEITLYQSCIAIVLMLPVALTHIPKSIQTRDALTCILLMGVLSTGIGCLIEIKGLIELGTTVSGIYLNFLPVITAAAGFLFLHDTLSIRQCIGAAVVIFCGFRIIRHEEELPEEKILHCNR